MIVRLIFIFEKSMSSHLPFQPADDPQVDIPFFEWTYDNNRILDFVGRCIFNRYCSTVRLKSSTIIYLRCSLVSHFKTFRNSGELKRLTCIKVFVACNNCNCNCIFENVVNGDWSNR